MTFSDVLFFSLIAVVGTIVLTACLRAIWLGIGAYCINRAGPRKLRSSSHVMWRDPGEVASLDMVHGPGGAGSAPETPFTFAQEHSTGSQPCVSVTDARGRRWRVKWGNEVRSENFAVRLAWACGYFAETTYFVPAGRVEGTADLQRARGCIAEDGSFTEARFELDDPDVRKMFEEHSWAWNDNPFLGTHQLNGLKILVMLLSNWDTKDRRDVARGSNTAIFEQRVSRWRREAHYLITDWGGSMGRWGGNIVTRGRWDPAGFAAQTPEFITAVDAGTVQFGYVGQRTADVAEDISVEDAAWLFAYLGRVTDAQLGQALEASGASTEEIEQFTRALRERITQLGRAAGAVVTRPAA